MTKNINDKNAQALKWEELEFWYHPKLNITTVRKAKREAFKLKHGYSYYQKNKNFSINPEEFKV